MAKAHLEIANATFSEEGIEFTAEMLEAGVSACLSYDPRVEEKEDLAASVYVAMEKARRRTIPSP